MGDVGCFGNLVYDSLKKGIEVLMQDYRKDDPVVDVARLSFEPELVHVPAGPFLMGLTDEQIEYMRERYEWARRGWTFESEQPACTVSLPAFQIGRYPVTNAEYQVFVSSTGYRCPYYGREECFYEEEADDPVVEVTWNDARAYSEWLRQRTGKAYRLPTEAEWEKAARGEDGQLWPWGNDWDPVLANWPWRGPVATESVGRHSPAGDSPYGCADMVGNVWQWTMTASKDCPYQVLRGGSAYMSIEGLTCTYRLAADPDYEHCDAGFRVVVAPDPSVL